MFVGIDYLDKDVVGGLLLPIVLKFTFFYFIFIIKMEE